MSTKKMFMFLCFAMLSIVAVVAKDLKNVTFNVPQMVCGNCEKKVKDNIRFEKGVKDIKTNLDDHTVTITYDADKTTVENLVNGFKKIKYDVTCKDASAECSKTKECTGNQADCCKQ